MSRVKIRLMECVFDDGFSSYEQPSWDVVQKALYSLTNKQGQIELFEESENGIFIRASGSPGVYALDVMKDRSPGGATH